MNFLRTFAKEETTVDDDDVELSLGLSLNGRFGVNNSYANTNRPLVRASSVVDFDDTTSSFAACPPLTRTCSLPTEEEWRKRKELQSLRRSAAKRKRVEKLMNGKGTTKTSFYTPPTTTALPPLPRPPAVVPATVSIGSPGSGGGSSGLSDLESQPLSGITKDTELNSTASQHSVQYSVSNKVNVASKHTSQHSVQYFVSSSQMVNQINPIDKTLKSMLADMPCVSTKGDGVNGKRVEGFLYRYKKGEQVKIVCVCHGDFLTPAEFVRHGGGGDVEHPLRHIVVNPPSF